VTFFRSISTFKVSLVYNAVTTPACTSPNSRGKCHAAQIRSCQVPVELLISTPASGKTDACIQRIRTLLLNQPFTPVRVVLPDRLQTASFRRRLAEAGGAIGMQIGTFGDLYRELLEMTGRAIPVASPPMLHRLVQAAVEQVHAAGDLQHYAGLRQTPGFSLALRDIFAELKRALVYPETFLERAASGNPAQQELARLYQAYQARLQALGWADPEGLSWLAVEALQNNPGLVSEIRLLVVDGFDSFNNAQCQALRLLAPTVPDILITLPGEPSFHRSVHRRSEAAYQALSSSLPLTVRHSSGSPHLPRPLQQLEASLFEPGVIPLAPADSIHMIEARSPAEEAREALRWLKARLVRDKVQPQACAIITPDPDQYHPYLRQAAAEFGLPLRFTQCPALAQSPAISVLLDLLNLAVLNYPRRLLLDTLRSPYFDLSAYGLTYHDADVLDEVSRKGQVIEGREQWDDIFNRLAQSQPPSLPIDEEEIQSPVLPYGEQVTPLRQALNRFFDRLAPPWPSASLENWIYWLEDLLDAWRYYHQGASENDQAAFDQLRQVLRALVLGEAVIGVQELSYNQFCTQLQGALEGSGIQETTPGNQPSILVLRMIEGRGLRFRAVAILGLSEGIFPAVENSDPFLDEDLRLSLGLESRLQRQQPSLFYQAITRSDQFILFTRPYLADDGEKWEPSPYWKAVLSLLPEHSEQVIRPDDLRALNDAASPEEALFWAVRQHRLPRSFADLLPRWEYLRHAHNVLAARQAEQPAGPYEGSAEPLASLTQARYGAQHVWSVSRLEPYGVCPHQFFVRTALELEARIPPQPGLDAAQLGTLLHAILEQVYAAAEDPTDLQAVLAALPGTACQLFERAPLDLCFRPSLLWQKEQEQLILALENTIRCLAEEDADAGWRPVAYEQSFGRSGAAPLAVHTGSQTILLHGMIDRIDRDPAGRVRIIDYKTGSSHLSKQDLLLGYRLQLPLYALAAQEVVNLGRVTEGFYWALLKGEAGALKLSTFNRADDIGPQAAIDTAKEHLEHIVSGIRRAHFPPIPPKGGCPSYCPASAWCWRFTPGWGG